MPYLSKGARERIEVFKEEPWTPGELNYVLTKVCQSYLQHTSAGEPRYANYAEVIGALECAKLEFYRRAVAPYEDTAAAINGDVYEASGGVDLAWYGIGVGEHD